MRRCVNIEDKACVPAWVDDLESFRRWTHSAKGTISAGIVEGLNYNVKLTMKNSYGFRTLEAVKTALYHRLGDLPEPEFTHRFW